MAKYTFKQFQAEYPTDAHCLAKLMEINYGGTEIDCPACSAKKVKFHPMTKRRAYACQACGHHIYPCAGTVLRGTRTPLSSWLFALHIMACAPVAAAELERRIGCTYKTALRMTRAFRRLSAEGSGAAPAPQRRHAGQARAEQ